MKKLEIHIALREARRTREMTQVALAKALGIRQSAISMFESGRHDALSQEKIVAMAALLEVDLTSLRLGKRGPSGPTVLKYCPIDGCPSNIPYVVRGDIVFMPTLSRATAGQSTICRFCSEIMLDACPNTDCGADLNGGAFCEACRQPYVTLTSSPVGQPAEWADEERGRILELRGMFELISEAPAKENRS